MDPPIHIRIGSQPDVEEARRTVRSLARLIGFGDTDTATLALVVSELGTNLVRYACNGMLVLSSVERPEGRGLRIESHDDGPGIPDVAWALQDGHSTGGSLGGGLPGVQRLMDEFSVSSSSTGTRIIACKWVKKR